jgi:ATP-dependent RNA helicase DDX56/DBP9
MEKPRSSVELFKEETILEEPADTFHALGVRVGLDSSLMKCLEKLNILKPTPIQRQALPSALAGRDMLLRAPTGTGKTLSYSLPVLQKLLLQKRSEEVSRDARALILVPTRELCSQVCNHIRQLTCFCKSTVSCLSFASESMKTQEAWLKESPDIIISTPLRAVKHFSNGTFQLSAVDTLVVDEADLVLSYGYQTDVKTILANVAKTCQTILVSATLSNDLNLLRQIALRNPVVFEQEMKSNGVLKQYYLIVSKNDKDLVLYAFMKLGNIFGKILIFAKDIEACYRNKLLMEQFGVHAVVLNAELPFNSRQHIIRDFNKGVFDILIATDGVFDVGGVDGNTSDAKFSSKSFGGRGDDIVADTEIPNLSFAADQEHFNMSRGLDFQKVKYVINLDFPTSTKLYTHRIGRTARGGSSGTAISILEQGNKVELQALIRVQNAQPRAPVSDAHQPCMLNFNISDIEGFRYRVEDTKRCITKVAVKNARVKELQHEILNSSRLKNYFKENPQDLQILQHGGSFKRRLVKCHLASVPEYLIPPDVNLVGKHTRRLPKNKKRQRSCFPQGNSLLKSFSYKGSLSALENQDKSDPVIPLVDVATSEFETTGRRKEWQRRHKKGRFSKFKERGLKRKKKLGINFGFIDVKSRNNL